MGSSMSNKIRHIYRSIEGWFNFEDLYSDVASQVKDDWKLVEIGCWQGRSSSFLATELANSGKKFDFYCVDTWSGSEEHLNEASDHYNPLIEQEDWLYNRFMDNMQTLQEYFTPIRKESIEAAKDFEDNSLDFVFIDASHDYDNVMADLEAWYPKMKKCECCGHSESILTGHDFPFDGVAKAVMDFCFKNKLQWKSGRKHVSDTCWRIYV
jgi:cephalosporin hydroxylase